MAITIVGTATGSSNGGAFSIATPTGTANGDLLVTFAGNDGDTSGASLTVPSGWTLLENANDGAGLTLRFIAYYHVWLTGDPTSNSWTMSASQGQCGVCVGLRGEDSTPTIVHTSQQTDTSGSTTISTSAGSGLTPSASNDMLLIGYLLDNFGANGVGTITVDATTTQDATIAPSTNTQVRVTTAHKQLASASATGDLPGTASATTFARAGIQVSVKTAAAGGTPYIIPPDPYYAAKRI